MRALAQRNAAPLFSLLCEKYAPSLKRDPSFAGLLSIIGRNWFKIRPAPNKMEGLMAAMMGGGGGGNPLAAMMGGGGGGGGNPLAALMGGGDGGGLAALLGGMPPPPRRK
jgi:hypothetical protein